MIDRQIISEKNVDLNRSIETFFIAALLLFSVLEEADWLCFSASYPSDDLVNDESSWNIYRLLPLTMPYKNPPNQS